MILLFFGFLAVQEAPGIPTNQPTPLIGVWERINASVFIIWIIVPAIVLVRGDKNAGFIEQQKYLKRQ